VLQSATTQARSSRQEVCNQSTPPLHAQPVKMSNQPPAGGSRKISFNVSDQYDIQDVIGEGAYGVVW